MGHEYHQKVFFIHPSIHSSIHSSIPYGSGAHLKVLVGAGFTVAKLGMMSSSGMEGTHKE
jgi:hypothetical protein